MDENTNIEVEQTSDSFLDGWDDNGAFDKVEVDQPETESEVQAEEQKPEETTVEEPMQTEVQTVEEKQPEAQTEWNYRYLGEDKKATLADVTPELFQKAANHDRLQEKWNEAKPVYEMFAEFAKQANMSIADYTTYLRQEAKKAKGLSDDDAKREVALEDREAAIKVKEEAEAEQAAAKGKEKIAQQEKQAKIQADLDGFRKAFPKEYENALKDPKSLPSSVWDDVKNGIPLVAAYAKYAVSEANKNNALAEQNRKNASRSTGSMKSAGAETENTDPFLKDW